jgi:gas vesicle protein
MKKQSKTLKSTLKKLSAPVILLFGLVLGFVVDRVTNLLLAPKHEAASQSIAKPAPALAITAIAPAQPARAAKKTVAKVVHRKHSHAIAAAKKHKGKKAQRVASSK